MSSCENGRLTPSLTFRVPSQGTGTVSETQINLPAWLRRKGRECGEMGVKPGHAGSKMEVAVSTLEWITATHLT